MNTQKRRLHFESLESRMPLAGNVTASVVNGSLTVLGDMTANDVEIRQLTTTNTGGAWGGYSYRIIGRSTTINGIALNAQKESSFTVTGVKTAIDVQLRAGDDTLRVTRIPEPNEPPPPTPRANFPERVSISMGDGRDTAFVYCVSRGTIDINLGGGDDILNMSYSTVNNLNVKADTVPAVTGNVSPSTADGSDGLALYFANSTGRVSVDLGNGSKNNLELGSRGMFSDYSVVSGSGVDDMFIDAYFSVASSASRLSIASGAGNDTIRGRMPSGVVNLDTGSGDDYIAPIFSDLTTSFSVNLGTGNDKISCSSSIYKVDAITIQGGAGTDEIFQKRVLNPTTLVVDGFEIDTF